MSAEKDMNDIDDPSDGKEVITRGNETTNANDGDKPRQTAATDTRIARNNDNDPSDEMEVEINTCEKTNANTQEKGKKMNKRKRGPTK